MSTIEERQEYLDNPFLQKPLYGDFTAFYITIAVCTLFGVFLFALNLIFGCCSEHKGYWNDRFTGNRWIVSFWTATPHKQPPLDLSELQDIEIEYPNSYPGEIERLETPKSTPKAKRAAFGTSPESQAFQYSAVAHKPVRGNPGEEFVELQKRESAI